MDQSAEMIREWTGALAPMTNASERYNTSLWEYFSPTPPITGFSTVESHRRVSDGAGAPRFYPTGPAWVGVLTAA